MKQRLERSYQVKRSEGFKKKQTNKNKMNNLVKNGIQNKNHN